MGARCDADEHTVRCLVLFVSFFCLSVCLSLCLCLCVRLHVCVCLSVLGAQHLCKFWCSTCKRGERENLDMCSSNSP